MKKLTYLRETSKPSIKQLTFDVNMLLNLYTSKPPMGQFIKFNY